MLEYVDLRLPDIQALQGEETIFFISVSPIEVHGPHLPVGTDVFIAEELQRRYISEISLRHPELNFVRLPPLYAGADALPVKGSLSIPARCLERILFSYGKGLAEQGFKYLFVSDNHGGPRHQIAIEAAARGLWKRHKFYLINPFGLDYRLMVLQDSKFMEMTGIGPGKCGDDQDNHAGTNETSLMLACAPEKVSKDFTEVPPSIVPDKRGVAALVSGLSKIASLFGGGVISQELEHLANTLAWINDPIMKPYMGEPANASKEAGEAMFAARVKVGVELFERALASGGKEPVHIVPMLWFLRAIRYLPG